MKTVPVWGKTVGIMMICLGALGLLSAIYKIIFPSTIQMQDAIMDGMQQDTGDLFGNRMMSTMREMLVITKFQANLIMISGIITLLGCGAYIAAGIKMLKPQSKNYYLARNVLIGFIIVNLLTIIIVLTDGYSMMVLGVLMYPIIGLIFDIVLVIIMASSDKSGYDIGEIADLETAAVETEDDII